MSLTSLFWPDPDLAFQVRIANAVNASHRADAERFHRASSLLHGHTVGTDCSPLLDAGDEQVALGQQLALSADRVGAIEPDVHPGASLDRPRSQRAFAPCARLDGPRLLRFLSRAYCGEPGTGARAAAASAGAIYPVHVLLVPLCPVDGVPMAAEDVVHVAFLERALYRLHTRRPSQIARACFGCELDARGAAFRNMAFLIAYAFDLDLGTLRYGARGYRFGLLECGAMTQQAALAASSQGLGSCLFGGFADAQLTRALGLRPHKMPVMCVQVFGLAQPTE